MIKLDEEQKRAIRYALEMLVVSYVSVDWAIEKVEQAINKEIILKPDTKLPHEMTNEEKENDYLKMNKAALKSFKEKLNA